MKGEEEMRLQLKWIVEELLPRAQETSEEEAVFRAKEAKQRAQIKGRLTFGQEKINEMRLVKQAENTQAMKNKMEVEEESIWKQGLRLVEDKIHNAQELQQRIRVKQQNQRCLSEEQHRILAAEEVRQEGVVVQKQFLIDLLSSLSKGDIQLPQAIEKVIALKNESAHLLGIDVDAAHTIDDKGPPQKSDSVVLVDIDDDATIENIEFVVKNKESTNKHRKINKKNQSLKFKAKTCACVETHDLIDDIDVEYIQVIDVSDPLYLQYMKILLLADDENQNKEVPVDLEIDKIEEENIKQLALRRKPVDIDDQRKYNDNRSEEEKKKLSLKRFKKLNRMEIVKLKQNVGRPEALEVHDITSKDPVLLLHLKASCNDLPVACHRCSKSKYCQGEFKIDNPGFNKQTSIIEMQPAIQEKDQKTGKTKMCESESPKLGDIDIDYQKICDDIFQWHYNFKTSMVYVTPEEETLPICSV